MHPLLIFPVLLIVFLAVLVSGHAAQDQDGELKHLAGTWTVVSAEEAGEKKKEFAGAKIVIEGNMLTFKIPKLEDERLRFRVDATKKPKDIDIEQSKEETVRGIYSLDGDIFKLCVNTESEKRPAEFATKKGRGHRLFVCKREEQK